jgi:hypothetical protein
MPDMLYRRIDLPSDEPVTFFGCYVLRWGRIHEPTVAFVEVEDHCPLLLAACEAVYAWRSELVRIGLDEVVQQVDNALRAAGSASVDREDAA